MFFYAVQHLDSTASYLPTGLHLGFYRSWPSLFLPPSFSSVFLVLSFVSASTSIVFWVVFLLPFYIYRVSQEERTKLREGVPYVKLYRYNPKYLYPKLNGYGDNGHRKVWASVVFTYCKPSVTSYSSTAHGRQRETTS